MTYIKSQLYIHIHSNRYKFIFICLQVYRELFFPGEVETGRVKVSLVRETARLVRRCVRRGRSANECPPLNRGASAILLSVCICWR